MLHLIVLECVPGSRAYGVEIDCRFYAAYEEAAYSIAIHGDGSIAYKGDFCVKEAVNSHLLDIWGNIYSGLYPRTPDMRHFFFIGNDFCYEILGFGCPVIRSFASGEEAFSWQADGSGVIGRKVP